MDQHLLTVIGVIGEKLPTITSKDWLEHQWQMETFMVQVMLGRFLIYLFLCFFIHLKKAITGF